MTDNNDHDNIMKVAIESVSDGPLHIAYELRRMANAEQPYTRFSYMSPAIKNVWMAAAEILEKTFQRNDGTLQ